VIAFLIFGSPPPVTSQTMDGGVVKPVERPKPANLPEPERPVEEFVLHGDTIGLQRVSCAPDGRTLFTGGRDRVIRVWDLPQRRCTSEIRGHASEVYFVRLAPSGTRLLSSSADGTARLWAYPGGKEIKRLDVEKGKLWCAIFGRNENEIVT